MKTCVISGNFSSDTAERNPTMNLCDDCVAGDARRTGEQLVFQEEEYDPDRGEVCEWCGRTAEEEALAWAE